MVLPADKGRMTVLMKTEEYEKKMLDLLSQSEYHVLKNDPTASTNRAISKNLNELQKAGHITGKIRIQIVAGGDQMPKIYGLPKVHKPEIPLRLIVSFINSSSYKLAQFLADSLLPLVGNTEHHIRDSIHFKRQIKDFPVSPISKMVSFDMTSLFTKIPIEKTLQYLEKCLRQSPVLLNSINIPITEILYLVRLTINSTYFSFKNQIKKQKEGAPMGSLSLPIFLWRSWRMTFYLE